MKFLNFNLREIIFLHREQKADINFTQRRLKKIHHNKIKQIYNLFSLFLFVIIKSEEIQKKVGMT